MNRMLISHIPKMLCSYKPEGYQNLGHPITHWCPNLKEGITNIMASLNLAC